MGQRLQWLWLFGSFAAAAVSLAVEFYLAWILNASPGVVALMFSGLTILSIGILIGPFALALTFASIAMLAWNNLSRRGSDTSDTG